MVAALVGVTSIYVLGDFLTLSQRQRVTVEKKMASQQGMQRLLAGFGNAGTCTRILRDQRFDVHQPVQSYSIPESWFGPDLTRMKVHNRGAVGNHRFEVKIEPEIPFTHGLGVNAFLEISPDTQKISRCIGAEPSSVPNLDCPGGFALSGTVHGQWTCAPVDESLIGSVGSCPAGHYLVAAPASPENCRPLNVGPLYENIYETTATGPVDIAFPRARQAAYLPSIGNRLILFGGADSAQVRRNDVWSFDVVTHAYQQLIGENGGSGGGTPGVHFPEGRSAAGVAAIGTDLYVYGGYRPSPQAWFGDLWKFDTLTVKWTRLYAHGSGFGPGLRSDTVLQAIGSRLYIFGGSIREGGATTYGNDVWSYDVATGAFARIKDQDNGSAGGLPGVDFPAGRSFHGLAANGSRLYIFGGKNGAYLNDLWSFETADGPGKYSFTRIHDGSGTPGVTVPAPRTSLRMVSIGTKLFIFGGASYQHEGALPQPAPVTDPVVRRGDLWVYELSPDKPSPGYQLKRRDQDPGPDLAHPNIPPVPRSAFGFGTVGYNAYIFGGDQDPVRGNDVWKVNPYGK